jgi:hypothetical protein
MIPTLKTLASGAEKWQLRAYLSGLSLRQLPQADNVLIDVGVRAVAPQRCASGSAL